MGLCILTGSSLYFYRDELPDDLEDVLEGNKPRLEEAPVPGEVVHGTPVVPKAVKLKKGKNGKADREPVIDKAPIVEPTRGEQGGVDKRAEINEDNEVPDPDTMYEAQCILKQRLRKGGKRQFLVKLADQTSTDSWSDEIDVSDALLAHWFIMHKQKGLNRKRLNLAIIYVPSTWARRRWWETETPARIERVD